MLCRHALDLRPVCQRQADRGRRGQFRSLAEPWADTATSTGRLMIAVLGGLADVERDLIRTRTAEGRNRAKARGQHMGRPPKLTPQQQKEARRRRAAGRNAQGTRQELQRRPGDDFEAQRVTRGLRRSLWCPTRVCAILCFMSISITPEQQAWLAAHVERGEFASVDEAVRQLIDERIAERMIEEDDLAWAKPLVDEALAAVARGEVISREEHEARMDAVLASLKV